MDDIRSNPGAFTQTMFSHAALISFGDIGINSLILKFGLCIDPYRSIAFFSNILLISFFSVIIILLSSNCDIFIG